MTGKNSSKTHAGGGAKSGSDHADVAYWWLFVVLPALMSVSCATRTYEGPAMAPEEIAVLHWSRPSDVTSIDGKRISKRIGYAGFSAEVLPGRRSVDIFYNDGGMYTTKPTTLEFMAEPGREYRVRSKRTFANRILFQIEPAEMKEIREYKRGVLDAFAYSRWIDRDSDSLMGIDELVDRDKKAWTVGETIRVAVFSKGYPIGTDLGLRLFPPGKEVPALDEIKPTDRKNQIRTDSFVVEDDLVKKYGAGEYVAEWYVEGENIGQSTFTVREPTEHERQYTGAATYAFICSTWIDRNKDDSTQAFEYYDVGDKERRVGESVLIVLSTHGYPVGTNTGWRLFPPNHAEPVLAEDEPTKYARNIRWKSFTVYRDLFEKYGAGQYRVEWSVAGELVAQDKFSVPEPTAHERDYVQLENYGFVCSSWKDVNKDGFFKPREFLNVGKKEYRPGETVTFALSTHGYPGGTKAKWRIFPPGAKKSTMGDRFSLKQDHNLRLTSHKVKELKEKYGLGEYRIEWYVNDKLVAENRIAVVE